jgi:hypothetical protein
MGSRLQHAEGALMRRMLVRFAFAYAALIAFCGLGAGLIPASVQERLRPYFWLLGPPANLVHGTKFLWPFGIGTVVVAGLFLAVTRTESPGVQVACGVALIIAWMIFGFLVYAPGA